MHIAHYTTEGMFSPALFFLLLQTNLKFFADSYCFNDNGNYTVNSTYADNLDATLSSLPTNISNNGFYNSSVGSLNPDRANAIALCKGDAQLVECRGCIRNITSALRAQCPNQRQATEWRDECTLRYSNETLLGVMATQPALLAFSTQNATDPTVFMADLRTHLDSVREMAANGGSLRKVGFGNTTANDFQYIFAMVQCSPDLSSQDCRGCLISAAEQIPRCCYGRKGGSVQYTSCRLRYETYLFYNDTRLLELSAPAPLPPSTSPSQPPSTSPSLPQPQPPSTSLPLPQPQPQENSTTHMTIIIVVVSIGVCVILSISVYAFLRKRMKRKPEEIREILEAIDEMSTAESLKYDLSTIRAATNDFSNDNKLGQGGFGVVYRGKLSNDQEIAVKRLSMNSVQGGVEFKNEVLLLAKLQHRNLVRLLGFCLEKMEKLLIYEFVQNASLDHFIFDQTKRALLDWEKRYKIIGGVRENETLLGAIVRSHLVPTSIIHFHMNFELVRSFA